MMSVSLPVINYTESGQPVDDDGSSGIQIPVPLCEYHCFLAMGIGRFSVKSDANMGKYQLIAPYEMIRVVEAVVNAMAITGKIQEIFKSKEDAEKQVAEIKNQTR